MITIRPAAERGATKTYWLDSRHTFSFNNYYNPQQMGFSDLRVINEDWVRGGSGFGKHGHRDMEIITYVLSGAVEHEDSTGGKGVIRAGEVQQMSAGTGILHSEQNPLPDEELHLYQIWILPEESDIEPGYKQRAFTPEEKQGRWCLIASRDGAKDSLVIHQDAKVYLAALTSGTNISYDFAPQRSGWLQVTRGEISLDGETLAAGDGATITDESALEIAAQSADAEVMLFDLRD